jgi:hypothetical protein
MDSLRVNVLELVCEQMAEQVVVTSCWGRQAGAAHGSHHRYCLGSSIVEDESGEDQDKEDDEGAADVSEI